MRASASPVSSHSSRRAASRSVSPSSTPPPGVIQNSRYGSSGLRHSIRSSRSAASSRISLADARIKKPPKKTSCPNGSAPCKDGTVPPETPARRALSGLVRALLSFLPEEKTMRLIRWNEPYTPFRSFEKLFEDFGMAPAVEENKWLPAVDVTESEEGVKVRAEVPGMNADDLDISVHGDRLTIRGEKKDEKEEKGEQWHRVERYHGAFVRNLVLPSPVDLKKIDADVKDGVLTIDFHKKPEDKTRRIDIKTRK